VAERVKASTSIEGQPGTRRAILMTLKKQGEARAEELAALLDITPSAVRQQLTGLVGDGLIGYRELRVGPGRPKHVYHLTPAADGLFPKTYSELTNELLDYVGTVKPGMVDELFEMRRRRRVEGAAARLAGKSFDERVCELTKILDEDGYLADYERQDDGTWRIVEHNCAILGVAAKYGQACSSEIGFLREALPEADIERVHHMMAGAHMCAYEIRERTPA
jgi:DeoR family transcriptional regulator, suf operon transcriptional repressor